MKLHLWIVSIVSFLIFASVAFAQSAPPQLHVNCSIQELVSSAITETKVCIDSSTDHHGAIIFPKLSVISEIDMMIALHEGLLIVNLYHNPTGISAGSHADITGGKNAHTQMILGNDRSISLNCSKVPQCG